MEERNRAIELFRFLAALLIITIHTGLFSDMNQQAYFLTANVLARMAVPFFALCSGYFSAEKLEKLREDRQGARAWALRRWKKTVGLYIVCTAVYLLWSIPFWKRIGWYSPWAFVDYAVAAVRSGSHYHLWYLLGTIYAWPVFCLCIRKTSGSSRLYISALLYALKALTYGYRRLLPGAIYPLMETMDQWGGFTSAVLVILPFMLLGAWLLGEKTRWERWPIRMLAAGTALLLAAYALEAVAASRAEAGTSYLFFTYPAAAIAFLLCLRVKVPVSGRAAAFLGAVSVYVYCFHPVFVELWENSGLPSVALFLLAAAASAATGSIIVLCLNKLKNR